MQISNRVSARGFVLGWEIAHLGNALSCLATLFVLARRTGVPVSYPFAERYADLFQRGAAVATYDPRRSLDRAALRDLVAELEPLLATAPVETAPGTGTPFADLGRATASGVVWRTRFEGSLHDWLADGAEDHVRRFCRGGVFRRGNGLVLTGAYWRHYTDMRPLKADGHALRRHLGPLRPDGLHARRQHMAAAPGLKIGVHVRQGDYAVWIGGRYFFTSAEYRGVIERLRAELGGRPHSLYLFSGQALDETLTGAGTVHAGQGTAMDDFLGLARCDLVVGPPSTFATWAAFLGGARRLVLTRETLDGPLLQQAAEVPFPTGAYLPGDATAGPI